MTKFSIVITTYNRLTYLKRAVNSAINQTVECEVIVVDDFSSDSTFEYLKSLGKKVKWYRNSVNLGHAFCVNKGVEISQGKWIKLLDDDDYLAPNCIEKILTEIEQNLSAVICSCQAINVNQKEQPINVTKKVGNQKTSLINQEDIHYLMLIDKLPFGTPVQVAFSKDAFTKSGGWNSDFNYCYDDIESWVKIAQFGDAIFINQTLAFRTIWSGGNNQKFSIMKRLQGNILIKENIYNLINNKHKDYLPSRLEINKYLELYWGLIALKNKKFSTFLKLVFPAIFSFNSWQFILYKFINFSPIKVCSTNLEKRKIINF